MSDETLGGVTDVDIDAAREEVIEAMAQSAEACGAKRSYGRLYGLLYFATEPLSLDELVEQSGYAKSTVSTAMSALERFHLVQRRSLPGEGKRVFFEPEEDFWYVFQHFLDRQVRREIENVANSLEAVELVLDGAGQQAERDLERVRKLQTATDHSEELVDVLVSDELGDLLDSIEQSTDDGE